MTDRPAANVLMHVLQAALRDREPTPDAALLERYVRSRDHDAFEMLVHRHGPMVWAVCRHVLRDDHAAEDAFQAAFLQLARRAGSVRNPAAVAAWLHRVAHHSALAAVRVRRGFEPLPPDVPDTRSGSNDETDTARLVDAELNQLPARYREVIVLCDLEGLTRPDAAKRLGVKVGTIDSRLARGRAVLRKRLVRRGVTGAGVVTGVAGVVVPERLAAAAVRVALGPPREVPLGVAAVAARTPMPGSFVSSLALVATCSAVVALAVAAGGWVGSPAPDRPPPVAAKQAEPAAREIRPEGLTARVVFSKDLPVGASGVAFGPGGRVALGGWMEPGTGGVATAPGRVWTGTPDAEPVEAGPHGPGPVAFRPDGTPVFLVLPSSARWSLLLWDGNRNQKLAEIPLPSRGAAQVRAALSADGTLAAATVAAADDETGHTLVWKLPADGEPVRELHHWNHAATALAFSPKNEFLAVGRKSGDVSVRSVATGEQMASVSTGHAAVLAVAFGRNFWTRLAAPTGPDYLLAAGGKGGHLGVWDLTTGSRVQTFGGSEFDVHAVAFSPDGAQLASVGRNHPVVWDVSSGRAIIQLRVPGQSVFRNWMTGIAFSPDGRRLAITSAAKFESHGGLDVVDLAESTPVRALRGLNAPVQQLFLSPRGNWVVGLSQDWQLGVWDAATGRLVRVIEVQPGGTADNAALRFEPDEREMVFAAGSRVVKLDIATGREVTAWRLPAAGGNDQLARIPDGNWLLFHSERAGPVWAAVRRPQLQRAYDLLPDGQVRERYTIADVSDAKFAALAGDGKLLVIGTYAGSNWRTRRLHWFDGRTGERLAMDVPGDGCSLARTSPAGSWMVLNRAMDPHSAETIVIDCSSGRRLHTHPSAWNAVDDTGHLLAGDGGSQGIIQVIQAGPGTLLKRFDAPRFSGNGHNVSVNGRFVAWVQIDGTVRIAEVDRPR